MLRLDSTIWILSPVEEGVNEACHLFSANLKDLTYERKRFVLEALQIRILVDGEALKLEGVISTGNHTMIHR